MLSITAASILGGIYSILSLYINGPYVLQLVLHISALILICAVATPSKSAKMVLKVSACFFLISTVSGGIITSIFSYLGRYFIFGGQIYGDVSAFELLCFVLLICGLCVPFFVKTGNKLSSKTVSVSMRFHGKEANFEALIDSGNLLTDPVSNDGIILIKHSALIDIFTEKQLDAIKRLDVLSESFPTGIRLVSSDKGLIPVFRPENVQLKLFGEKDKRSVSIVSGIDFSSGSFGGASSLIPSLYVN